MPYLSYHNCFHRIIYLINEAILSYTNSIQSFMPLQFPDPFGARHLPQSLHCYLYPVLNFQWEGAKLLGRRDFKLNPIVSQP